ncbi:benzoate 4-monooxygenase cytochrome p450 [Diaporthe amygdali]|uniref:benzoate 4-monooxygenase cytochrome p450 n=1 Tax=Phomopsis amygdali TaxID=1214568 RepID=UPI0022FE7E32|nr:benzoate 4-monooxygenase cytochrome p450 [Diaporthe amygdali]KAJ0115404.1 benzoate 4-monooxygenase cytochrome p450 [Diaporthe amygdali]
MRVTSCFLHGQVVAQTSEAALSKECKCCRLSNARLEPLATLGHGNPALGSVREGVVKVLGPAVEAPEGDTKLHPLREGHAVKHHAAWPSDTGGDPG